MFADGSSLLFGPDEETMQEDQDLSQWLTPGGAAQKLGISTVRVRQLANRGTLQPIWTPMGRLFDPAEVERLRRSREGLDGQPAPAGAAR